MGSHAQFLVEEREERRRASPSESIVVDRSKVQSFSSRCIEVRTEPILPSLPIAAAKAKGGEK